VGSAIGDGDVLALIDHGELKILRATAENSDIVATRQVSTEPTWAPPVLLPNALLVKGRESLAL
jgi:hypothetical protein